MSTTTKNLPEAVVKIKKPKIVKVGSAQETKAIKASGTRKADWMVTDPVGLKLTVQQDDHADNLKIKGKTSKV